MSSWVDSGANQLAMLAPFAAGWGVTSHEEDAEGMRSVTDVAFDGGSATLTSSWWTGASSKQTVMLVDAGVRGHFGNDGTVDRKTAHYGAMDRALLDGTGPRPPPAPSRRRGHRPALDRERRGPAGHEREVVRRRWCLTCSRDTS